LSTVNCQLKKHPQAGAFLLLVVFFPGLVLRLLRGLQGAAAAVALVKAVGQSRAAMRADHFHRSFSYDVSILSSVTPAVNRGSAEKSRGLLGSSMECGILPPKGGIFMLTYGEITKSEAIRTYIIRADESLRALGYTEHCFAHVVHVAEMAGDILKTMGYDDRTVELAKIAGYLHDIGNLVNRVEHSQSGAVMAWSILHDMGCDAGELATIVTAIGNHDEGNGVPVNPVAAALILADKADVRRTRVRNRDISTFDIHDRVNYSVIKSRLQINEEKTQVILNLTVDHQFGSIMDYFEIFMGRMLLCRKAAERLGLKFKLIINDQQLI
jgi:HD superfamily phosphodiesterase